MAQEDREDRTEPASQRRLEKAREEGRIVRSRELGTCLAAAAAFLALGMAGPSMGEGLLRVMRASLQAVAQPALPAPDFLRQVAGVAAGVLAPVFLASLVAAVAGALALGGWVFSSQAMALQLGRLDPLAGLGRLFSSRTLVELGKTVLKVVLVAAAGYLAMVHELDAILSIVHLEFRPALGRVLDLVFVGCLAASVPLVLLAAIDWPWQRFSHARDLRMSKDEVRRELRESEGDPLIKRRIRQNQRALARRRMMSEVPKANVVVTNPTHFAVALQYRSEDSVPRVVAKGRGLIARRIREVACDSQVPLVEAPALARALYAHVALEQAIPESLYTVVAQVLAWVYQLRRWEDGLEPRAPAALEPQALEVPLGLDPGVPAAGAAA